MCIVGIVLFVATRTDGGRVALAQFTAVLNAKLGRPLPSTVVLGMVCLVVAVLAHLFIDSFNSTTVTAKPDSFGSSLRDAYQQGYDDALAGLDPRYPQYFSSSTPLPEEDRGFGFGSLMRLGLCGSVIYRAGVGPGGWSLSTTMRNFQANPMQIIMSLMMCMGTGFLF